MSSEVPPSPAAEVVYPESDGQPMADNTLQWDWMVKIVGELRAMFRGQNVFVAGDLFWYPVRGNPRIFSAPDAMVAFGRPPGYRGSYKQWEEEGVAPQVVFEVLSPSNNVEEMDAKLEYYERHGVEEFYIIDPYEEQYEGYVRVRPGGVLRAIRPVTLNGWISPRLDVRFEVGESLKLFAPDGREFQTNEDRVEGLQVDLWRTEHAVEDERSARIEAERAAEAANARANEERIRAEAERARADAAAEAGRLREEALLAAIYAAGLDPKELLRRIG